MRRVVTSLFVAGCISPSALAFQARSGGAAGGKACALLPRDLVMKILPDTRKKELEREKPEDDRSPRTSRQPAVQSGRA